MEKRKLRLEGLRAQIKELGLTKERITMDHEYIKERIETVNREIQKLHAREHELVRESIRLMKTDEDLTDMLMILAEEEKI